MYKNLNFSDQAQHSGLVWARAVMCLVIVGWHVQVLGKTSALEPQSFAEHNIGPVDLIYFNCFHLAVPVFFLISLFLFCRKGWADQSYFRPRMLRLAKLYFFWLLIAIIILKTVPGINYQLPDTWMELLIFIPAGGNTLFYFLFSLMLCTCLCRMFRGRSLITVLVLLAVSLLVVGSFPFLCSGGFLNCMPVAYWSPLNFIPYVFVSLAIARMEGAGLKSWSRYVRFWIFVGCVLLFATMSALEWNYLKAEPEMDFDGLILPAYARLSVVFGAIAVFLVFLRIDWSVPALICLISRNSLGIYCVHGFIMIALMPFFTSGQGGIVNFVYFALVVAGSIALTEVLKRVLPSGLI